MKERIVIEQGQIWEVVTDDFLTSCDNDLKRQIKIAKGDKIEIRYPYAWHFRTEDCKYFHTAPGSITDNCRLFGVIDGKVRFNNKASLEEILRLGLYETV